MYVITFYSFKGGVGRTMALVNTAVELANTGRRVLAVDFDLEAPGLDTFDFVDAETKGPGIIDFVTEYLGVGQAPDVNRFISKSSAVGKRDGGLWVMPSGAQHESYATKYGQIDWGTLYDDYDGYLLFEDLKAQWKEVLKPDYVLIDSRTGHTDTCGICTRQLPDAVAIFFFPNEQNLRGLTKVVHDIRLESKGPRKKEIDLHFVMSNVPDLDDEDRILEAKINAFRHQLDFAGEPATVHRYDSLSLLNQVVFTKDRPRSRLATEYREVVRRIVRRNPEDREGALDYIQQARQRRWQRGREYASPQKVENMLRDIEETHARDGAVLFALGELRAEDRRFEDAASLFERAIDAGYDEPEAFLRRATVRADNDDLSGANEDALQVLSSDSLPPPLIREAVSLATNLDAKEVARLPAVTALDADDRYWLASIFCESPRERQAAVSILTPLVDENAVPEALQVPARDELALAHIELGSFTTASDVLCHGGRTIRDMGIRSAFNYGMALWGKTARVVEEPFTRVVELDPSNPDRGGANYCQCMTIAYWATGNATAATDFVRLAREAIDTKPEPTFSCWRYAKVSPSVFRTDLDEIRKLIEGDASQVPRFISSAEKRTR